MKANEAYNQLYEAMVRGPGTAKGNNDIIMIDLAGNTYPIQDIHYNESLGTFVISSWKKEST